MQEHGDKGSGNHWIIVKICAVALLVGGGFFLYESGALRFFLSRQCILNFLDTLGPFAFIGFIVLQAAQVIVAPIPGEVTGLIGGYLFGLYWGTLLSTVGLVLGSYVAFALARAFGRPFVERFVDKAILDRFDYVLHHKGIFLVFLLFLIPGFPKDYLCFVVGLGHLTTREFLVISSIGRFFGTLMLTLGGGFLRCQQYERFGVLVLVALVLTVGMLAFRGRLERWLLTLNSRSREALGEAKGERRTSLSTLNTPKW